MHLVDRRSRPLAPLIVACLALATSCARPAEGPPASRGDSPLPSTDLAGSPPPRLPEASAGPSPARAGNLADSIAAPRLFVVRWFESLFHMADDGSDDRYEQMPNTDALARVGIQGMTECPQAGRPAAECLRDRSDPWLLAHFGAPFGSRPTQLSLASLRADADERELVILSAGDSTTIVQVAGGAHGQERSVVAVDTWGGMDDACEACPRRRSPNQGHDASRAAAVARRGLEDAGGLDSVAWSGQTDASLPFSCARDATVPVERCLRDGLVAWLRRHRPAVATGASNASCAPLVSTPRWVCVVPLISEESMNGAVVLLSPESPRSPVVALF